MTEWEAAAHKAFSRMGPAYRDVQNIRLRPVEANARIPWSFYYLMLAGHDLVVSQDLWWVREGVYVIGYRNEWLWYVLAENIYAIRESE